MESILWVVIGIPAMIIAYVFAAAIWSVGEDWDYSPYGIFVKVASKIVAVIVFIGIVTFSGFLIQG